MQPVKISSGEHEGADSPLVQAQTISAAQTDIATLGNRAETTHIHDMLDPKTTLVPAQHALPGRETPMPLPPKHAVFGTQMTREIPTGMEQATFAMGCFWGVERLFWQILGVTQTMVGYTGGHTPNPTYAELCSGQTAHTEAVLVTFDPSQIAYQDLLRTFWENHDPTQGMRQGADRGTQYRSGIYAHSQSQLEQARASAALMAPRLREKGHGPITTEIAMAPAFYAAEPEHQQYLAQNPNGYCGLKGTGVTCPIPARA